MPNMDFPPLFAFSFDGNGDATAADPTERVPGRLCWYHARWEDPAAEQWLAADAGISSEVHEALTAPETRPRCTVMHTAHGDGALINLRGVNLHEARVVPRRRQPDGRPGCARVARGAHTHPHALGA